jgi:HEAT repeat protein
MRRNWAIGAVLLLGTLGVSGLALRSVREPVYAGKKISQWLEAGYEDAAAALQTIGPAAGPYILTRLASEDSRYGTARMYRCLWTELPTALRSIVPKPKTGNFDELRASSMLLELGPSITPLLSSRLTDHNAAVRIACARTLGCLRQRGSNIQGAVPALTEALRDPNPEVAALAASAIGIECLPRCGPGGDQ